jgi:hypothetical protein
LKTVIFKCILYRVQAKGYTVLGSNPGKEAIFFSSPKHPDQLLAPIQSLLNQYQCTFPTAKYLSCDDHSPPLRAKVRNEWSCTSTPFICLHAMGRNNLTV